MTNVCFTEDGAALLLVDVQLGFDEPYWGERNNPYAETNIAALLEHWRLKDWPVLHVQHCSLEERSPLRKDRPGNAFKPVAEPRVGEQIFQKSVNSAFIGSNLESELRKAGISSLVIVGLTTDHCVSTTTRMAANLGFKTYIVHDATATFGKVGYDGHKYTAEEIHRTALASLKDEFATVLATQDILGR